MLTLISPGWRCIAGRLAYENPGSAGGKSGKDWTSMRSSASSGMWLVSGLCAVFAPLAADPSFAASQPAPTPVAEQAQPGAELEGGKGLAAYLSELESRSTLLGDMGGLRSLMSRQGLSFTLQETSEVLGNVTGGSRKGFVYDGLTQMTLGLDTAQAFGWPGGSFNVSALQYHGRNLSAENLLSLQTASGIEADRATRLWELWYDQKFLAGEDADVKIGQQSLDQEFMVSDNALLFVNTMFGWPMVPSVDLPGGGPAYPLSALGLRLRAKPVDSLTLLAGVFNGSPASSNSGDAQKVNPSGTSFPLNGGVLAIVELQYAFPSPGVMLYPGAPEPLPYVLKFGFWYDSEHFADQELDNHGLSLADPASTGLAQQHRGNYSFYAVLDQMLWRDAAVAGHSFNFFARAMGTPEADRNLVDFSLNAGFTLHAPFPERVDDTAGIGLGYARVSPRAAALDRDTAHFTGAFTPIRSGEAFIEATYQYALVPWLNLQPDIQYVFNPGGGIANPNNANRKVKDELVIGLRTSILF